MGKINVLEKYVAELIAAGEVVERPSSVVKELVENAIDAGSTFVEIEIENGGTTLIRVSDNGKGILREDVPTAFLRHATSKVKNSDDLDKIQTLGFRGEALASISAVSKVEMLTKTASEPVGTRYLIEGSEEVSIDDAGCPDGTTVIIKDLFYNTPARMKFLKKNVSEANSVAAIVDRIALSHPEISFKLIRNSKEELNTPGNGDIKSCIYSVYGKSFCEGLIPVKYEMNGVKVNGFVSNTSSTRPNRSMQHFFINGRYVKSKTGTVALEQAFKGSIMTGRFPSCVLYLDLSSEIVDVNVHPAKIEVRFMDERPIFDVIYHGTKTAIMRSDKTLEINFNTSNVVSNRQSVKFTSKSIDSGKQDLNREDTQTTRSYEFEKKKNTHSDLDDDPEVFVPRKSVDYSVLKLSDSERIGERYGKNAPENKFEKSEKKEDNELIPDSLSEGILEEKSDLENLNQVENIQLSVKEAQIDNVSGEPIGFDNNLPDDIELSFIGEIFNTYVILQQNREKVLLIDKHAAHERIIYEKLKKDSGKSFSQYLLKPVTITLEKEEYSAVLSNLKLFEETGFDIDDFGSGTVIVRSAPMYLDNDNVSPSIIEMAGYLVENKKHVNTEYVEWLYHNIACRAAIKAGDKSNKEELISLVKKLEENPELKHCPHGRPIFVSLTKKEIEKQFGRI